jgi:tetratricopeptide (TPR) repeat protein
MIKLGNAYYNNQQYKEAMDWYQKARDLRGSDSIDTTAGLALAAEGLGDKSLIIKYNQLAIEETKVIKQGLPASDIQQPDLDNDISVYQSRIDTANER